MNPASAPANQFLDEAKSLACIHCGLCLSSCPTYLETGNENNSPRGRIYLMRAIQGGRLPLNDSSVRHLDLCLGCRACEAACPSGVQYGALLESTREHVERHYTRSPFQRFLRRIVIEKIFPFPGRMKLALAPALLIKRLGLQNVLPKSAREALSLVPDSLSERSIPKVSPQIGNQRGRVGFIKGCVMGLLFGETQEASVKLLNLAGYEVVSPEEQTCCGALYAHGGNLEKARELARRNIAAFERLQLDAIIINAAGCGSTLKEYGHLLHDDSTWAKRAETFSSKVKDLSEWLVNQELPISGKVSGGITFHDACHLAHAQRITKPPRDLVRTAAGAAYVELPEADVCCGSAGSYNLTEPEMAERLQERKIQNIIQTGAKTIVTTNPGCILQIRAGLAKAGRQDIRVLHIADFLAERLASNPAGS